MWTDDPDGVRIALVEVPEDHPLRRDHRWNPTPYPKLPAVGPWQFVDVSVRSSALGSNFQERPRTAPNALQWWPEW
jgi:hypothetical protein